MINNPYKCAIIDDEPKAIELLKDSLGLINRSLVIADTFTSWQEAFTGIRTEVYDLIFLDISVQGRNGMDLLRSVPNLQSEVVFITAYSDYALNAFEFSAAGYLVKPIDEIALANTIDRAITRIEHKRLAMANKAALLPGRIGIPDQKSINYVDVADILYLEAQNTYTMVVTKDTRILSAYNLGKFRELLPEHIFYQIHRSYIVNVGHVRRYENSGFVVLDNEKELPVAQSVRSKFPNLFTKMHGPDTKEKK